LQKTNNFNQAANSNAARNKFFAGVPYTITFQLSAYAKTQDDALQIVEQIIPYFTPQYTLTITPFEEYPDVKEDVPIILSGVDFQDDYEGALEQRRTIIYTLTFDMKVMFYGPVTNQTIIRKVINNIYDHATNDQISKIEVTPNPADVSPDSDYGFNTLIDVTDPFDPYIENGYVAVGYILEP